MSPKEQRRVPSPENPQQPEEHTIYVKAAHFIDGLASQQAYTDIQSTLRTAQEQGEGWNLAGYHLTSQEDVSWYVAVAGQQPLVALAEKLAIALTAGVSTSLPEAFHDLLIKHNLINPVSTIIFEDMLIDVDKSDEK